MGGCCNKDKDKGEEEPKVEGDRAICGTLCLCQALAVLSAVSIIYLSVIIYLPAKREMESGIGETPVMCTTVEDRQIDNDIEACKSSSCAEWCLSKGGSSCRHIFVSVRQNGTDVDWEQCDNIVTTTCPKFEKTEAEGLNCARDNACSSLDQLFLCEAGVCWNITAAFSCTWRPEDMEPALDCYYKRNCIELDGMYSCQAGHCSKLNNWQCERFCVDIPTRDNSVVSMAGDVILSAECRRAVDVRTGEVLWDVVDHPGSLLLSSCTDLEAEDDIIRGRDCINGTAMPAAMFEELTNFTTLMNVFQGSGHKYKLDQPDKKSGLPRGTHIPFDTDIKIFNRTMLNVNHEGCVNTLMFECTEFYQVHGQDTRNGSSPARFPCFYSPHNPAFVVRRYDLVTTKTIFLMFFTIPSGCFLTSCLVLFACSQLVGVRRSGAMAIMPSCCGAAREEEEEEGVDMRILGGQEEIEAD